MQNNNTNTTTYNTNIESTRTGLNAVNTQQNPYIVQNNQATSNTNQSDTSSTFSNGDFIKGALIGAAVTFLLTNKSAQNTIFGAISKGNELFQAGMEELKERYEDMKAQREASEDF